jgi:hypothetical protein
MAFPATFFDIQTAVIVKARLDSTLDISNVKDWINQTYAQVCVETEANVSSDTMTLTPGTASYTLPTGLSRIKQMILTPAGSTQTQPPLIRTTLDEIISRRQTGGNVQNAGQYVTHYTVVGLNQFEVWPTPAAADVITLWIVALPTPLSANSDIPILQEPYASKLLEYGALVQAGDFKGDPSTADWENQYDAWTKAYDDHLMRRPGVVPGQFHQWGDGWGAHAW